MTVASTGGCCPGGQSDCVEGWEGIPGYFGLSPYLPTMGVFRVISSAQMRNLRSKDEKTLSEVCPSYSSEVGQRLC